MQVVGGTVVLPQFLLVEKIAVSYEDVDIPFVAVAVCAWWSMSLLSGRAGRSLPCCGAHAASHGRDSLSDHRFF